MELKKPSIPRLAAGLALVAGALLPWIVIEGKTGSVGLCPGCSLYSSQSQELLGAVGLSLWVELALLLAAGLLAIWSSVTPDDARSRKLLMAGVVAGVAGAVVPLYRLAGLIEAASDGLAEMPAWLQQQMALETVTTLTQLTSPGAGLALIGLALLAGIGILVATAPPDVSGDSWLTPLAKRFWFFELVEDFWFFLRERKAWWMTPIVVVLLLLVVLILVGEKAAVLPFIYTLF